MKRILSLVMLFVVAATCVRAQSLSAWDGLGLRLGLDVNCPTRWHAGNRSYKMYKPGGGFYLGAVYNMQLSGNFYFEPGAFLFYDTYRCDDITIDSSSGYPVETSPTIKKFGVRLPMVLGYDIRLTDNIGLALSTGPEFSYSFIGKVGINHHLDWGDDRYSGSGLFSDFGHRRYDIAWKVGVGLPVDKYYFGIDVAFGMIDQRKGTPRYHENRVNFGIGYNF